MTMSMVSKKMTMKTKTVEERLSDYAEFLLNAEMMLARAMTEDPSDNFGTAFSWINHARHTLRDMFEDELNESRPRSPAPTEGSG